MATSFQRRIDKGTKFLSYYFYFLTKGENAMLVQKHSPLAKGEPGFWPALSWGPSLSSRLPLLVIRCLEMKWVYMWYLYRRQRALDAMEDCHFSLARKMDPPFLLLFNHTCKSVKCLNFSEKGPIKSLYSSNYKSSEENFSWINISAHPVYFCVCQWIVYQSLKAGKGQLCRATI